jgi:hypothetical protein
LVICKNRKIEKVKNKGMTMKLQTYCPRKLDLRGKKRSSLSKSHRLKSRHHRLFNNIFLFH